MRETWGWDGVGFRLAVGRLGVDIVCLHPQTFPGPPLWGDFSDSKIATDLRPLGTPRPLHRKFLESKRQKDETVVSLKARSRYQQLS